MRTVEIATLATALGCGAMGGVFFAFSAFVMPALGRLPASAGIAAMQSVNVAAVRPLFMTGLFGTALLSLGLIVRALLNLGDRRSVLLLAGGALYLLGVIVLTAVYHIPLNNGLAPVDPASPAAQSLWATYLRNWTLGNGVRAIAGLAASATYILALRGR